MLEFLMSPAVYSFVRGPLVWIAFLVFIVGSAYRIYVMISTVKKEKLVLPYMSLRYSIRSILHWVIPFGSVNWRRHPVITIVTFLFHICLVFTPIFLLSHNILWHESWGISWWTLPESLADIMTLIVIFSCVFFFFRRIIASEVRFVTYPSDFLILAIAFLPFLTGFLAYHQWLLPHEAMVNLHILFGAIMLIAVPFSRIIHMIFGWFTRAYTGSEFGMVRHVRDY
ncbi:MAG: nitrate reductase [Nitrospirae bacterium]|jgi:nitrate reductase gamma subunit|nr:nitrate reductase [Nitrospirota bacterium]